MLEGLNQRLSNVVQFISEHWRWVRSPKIGGKYRLPPFTRWLKPDTRGWPTASAGEGFILEVLFGLVGGALASQWTKLTQVPSVIVTPLINYHRSRGYRWRTLARNVFVGVWGILVGAGELLVIGLKTAVGELRD